MIQTLFLNKWEKIKRQQLKESQLPIYKEKPRGQLEDIQHEESVINLEFLKGKTTEEDEAMNHMRAEYREKLRSQNEERKLLMKMKVRRVTADEGGVSAQEKGQIHVRLRREPDRNRHQAQVERKPGANYQDPAQNAGVGRKAGVTAGQNEVEPAEEEHGQKEEQLHEEETGFLFARW